MSDESEPQRPSASPPTERPDPARADAQGSPLRRPPRRDAPARRSLPPERNANLNGLVRIGMLAVVAIVMLANAAGWVDPDLWVPFVCIIAVMGIGTRGGPLESLGFVGIEAAVVLMLGVATFSGSRDFVWAASVGVSLVAIGKVAFLEVQRRESAAAERSLGGSPPPGPARAPRAGPRGDGGERATPSGEPVDASTPSPSEEKAGKLPVEKE
ncbi:MAG: hypothetical protein ACK6CU_12640 [Deltaproteobacteria bacterium]|jgi:hypothetical protein